MASAVIALPSGSLGAPPKSPKKAKKKSSGAPVSALIKKAVADSSERGGLSLVGLKKALKAGGYDVEKNNTRVLACVKRLVKKKTLVQTKGSGASGSFRLNKKAPTPRKRKAVKKKPKVKKVKRAGVKKAAGSASPAKKSPKKKKTTTPKKASAAKKPKKARTPKRKSPKKSPKRSPKKSPKKAPRRVKSTRTRAAAAKK